MSPLSSATLANEWSSSILKVTSLPMRFCLCSFLPSSSCGPYTGSLASLPSLGLPLIPTTIRFSPETPVISNSPDAIERPFSPSLLPDGVAASSGVPVTSSFLISSACSLPSSESFIVSTSSSTAVNSPDFTRLLRCSAINSRITGSSSDSIRTWISSVDILRSLSSVWSYFFCIP